MLQRQTGPGSGVYMENKVKPMTKKAIQTVIDRNIQKKADAPPKLSKKEKKNLRKAK